MINQKRSSAVFGFLITCLTATTAVAESPSRLYVQCLKGFNVEGIQRRIPSNRLGMTSMNGKAILMSTDLKTSKDEALHITEEPVAGSDRYYHVSAADKSRIGDGLNATTWVFTDTQILKMDYDPVKSFSPGAVVGEDFMKSDTPTAVFTVSAAVGDYPAVFVSLGSLGLPKTSDAVLMQRFGRVVCEGNLCISPREATIMDAKEISPREALKPQVTDMSDNQDAQSLLRQKTKDALEALEIGFQSVFKSGYQLDANGIDREIFQETDKAVTALLKTCGQVPELKAAVRKVAAKRSEVQKLMKNAK